MNRCGRREGAEVGLEDAEVAVRHRLVDVLGHGADDLQLDVAGRLAAGRPAASVSPVTSCQRIRKCSATSATAGPFDPRARRRASRPRRVPDGRWCRSGRRPPRSGRCRRRTRRDRRSRSSSRGGSASAAPVRRARTGSRVSVDQLLAHRAHVAARRAKERQRRTGPDEHPHVDPLGELGEQVAEHELARRRARAAKSGEKYQPVRWTCDRARCSSAAIAGSASAPSISTSTALPGRGPAGRRAQPPAGASSACSQPIRRQPPPVMGADLLRHLRAEPALDRVDQPAERGAMTVRGRWIGRRPAQILRYRASVSE